MTEYLGRSYQHLRLNNRRWRHSDFYRFVDQRRSRHKQLGLPCNHTCHRYRFHWLCTPWCRYRSEFHPSWYQSTYRHTTSRWPTHSSMHKRRCNTTCHRRRLGHMRRSFRNLIADSSMRRRRLFHFPGRPRRNCNTGCCLSYHQDRYCNLHQQGSTQEQIRRIQGRSRRKMIWPSPTRYSN